MKSWNFSVKLGVTSLIRYSYVLEKIVWKVRAAFRSRRSGTDRILRSRQFYFICDKYILLVK